MSAPRSCASPVALVMEAAFRVPRVAQFTAARASSVQDRGIMRILAGLLVVIQFCFAFHVFKTGRPYWWMFVIMGFPAMGCLIYYFVEVFPGSREHRRANRVARDVARALNPDAELRKRTEEVETCGSAANRLALADECSAHRMYGEAIRLYESCLQGAYSNDSTILFRLARAAVDGGDWERAGATIERLKSEAPKTRPLEVRLLEARRLEGLGRHDDALAVYRQVVPQFVGLEARYRYGELLLKVGKREAAMEIFNDVLKAARRFASPIEEEERWAIAAKQAVRVA